MNCRRACTFLLVVAILVVSITSMHRVEAARPMTDCSGEDGAYMSIRKMVRATMATWMARLPSGPSPSGPGH
ncbi:PAMP-induced secreted peptide 1 [Typha latifolia]|uniref:PAMP-induced secreted peptide 1 n=1 Tax=Typha latifolia TaxID=4733 RepID=UPI003C2F5E0E